MAMGAIGRRYHYGWVVLVVGTLVVFASLGLARFGYTVVLPEMQRGLGMDNTQAGALATANLIGYLVLSVTGGALAAHYGPRVVISLGLGVVSIAMFLTGSAHGFATAALWRVLTGVGSGASNVPVMGLFSAWFAPRRRGLASGVGVSGSSLALILLGPTVPPLLDRYTESGWRVAWCAFGGVTLVLALIAWLLLRNRPGDLGLSPLGADSVEAPNTTSSSSLRWGLVYRSRAVWHIGAVYTAFGFAYIIYMTFFKKYLVAECAYSQEAAGRLFMTMGWFSLLCGVLWGAVSDHIGRRAALIIVYLLQMIAYCLFALWPSSTGLTLSAILFGLTAWSIPAIMAAFCGDVLGPRLAPAGLGFVTLFFGIGQALGPSVAGAIADRTHSFSLAFLIAGGVSLLGALGAAGLHRQRLAAGNERPVNRA